MKKAKNKNTKWTDEEDTRLLEMRNNGADFSEIARKLGRTTEGVKGRWKKFNHIKNRILIRDDVVLAEKVKALSDDGFTEREICEDMGIAHGTLAYVKKSFGIKSVIVKMRERDKDTICWVCKNSLVNCTKPVDGFTATLKQFGEYDPPRWSYMVKKCPNFDPEPYAFKNGGREK